MNLLDPSPAPAEATAIAVFDEPPAAGRGPRLASTLMVGAALIAGWCAAVACAVVLETPDGVHLAALFLHLAFLIAGFGAVLTLDWFGMRWTMGRATLAEVVGIAEGAHLLIWIGLLGLTATGLLLEPTLAFWTCVKLGAVLVVALNGLNAMRLNHRLARLAVEPSRGLMAWAMATAMISQLGWWTACVIGFLNAH